MKTVHTPCQVCGADDADPVYVREHETGSHLGRVAARLVLCRGCGFLYRTPRPAPSEMAAYYAEATDASGGVFRETAGTSRHALLAGKRARFILESLSGLPSGRLLEVGCGRGDLLATLQLPAWHCTGLEPSPAAAARARATGLDVRAETLETSKLEGGSFDAILAVSVLEHVDDPALAVECMLELLAPEGVAVIEVPDSTRPEAQVAEFFSFEHLSHFTTSTLTRLFDDRGLGCVALEVDAEHSGIRAAFRRGPAQIEVPADGGELLAALDDYVAAREVLRRGVLTELTPRVERWRSAGTPVGVYGGWRAHALLARSRAAGRVSDLCARWRPEKSTVRVSWIGKCARPRRRWDWASRRSSYPPVPSRRRWPPAWRRSRKQGSKS